MTRNDADAIVHLLMKEWAFAADDDVRDRWAKVTPFIWVTQGNDASYKCTLNWPDWDLSIVTFDVPETLSTINAQRIINSQHIVLIHDELTEHGNPIICHAQVAADKYPGRNTMKMPVAELVDSFLAGEWTPWWTCRCCHMRKQMKVKPS